MILGVLFWIYFRFFFLDFFHFPISFSSPLHFSSLFSSLTFFNLYIYGPFAIIFRFMKCFPQYMPVNSSYHILCKEDILPSAEKKFSFISLTILQNKNQMSGVKKSKIPPKNSQKISPTFSEVSLKSPRSLNFSDFGFL